MRVLPVSPHPLGATWDGAGVTFAVFSEHATRVELCLFDSPDARVERARIPLAQDLEHVWHARVPAAGPGQLYAYRAHGPWAPELDQRFDAAKLLLDPYALAIGRTPVASQDAPHSPLGAVIDRSFDWGSDRSPATPWEQTVIYELHVKGFSAQNDAVPEHLRGTYLGLAADASIRHLKRLGVTAVELLPIHAHADEPRLLQQGLVNYWGYNTVAFFAPDPRFSRATTPAGVVHDFKAMVAALHAAGLEVILDVVYNHTAEGDDTGPTLSLRGLDNRAYYRLDPARPGRYEDVTGCGNTLDLRQPAARRLVMDSLRYWVEDMHVDGFRFDLAASLARVDGGAAALFGAMTVDPVLAGVKLIAEPWDLGPNGYQLGQFPAGVAEWNDQYRKAVRQFWRGDGAIAALATRIGGSSDLFEDAGRPPQASINFVTCHDGFALADLVAYNSKHNEANGEGNRDGESENLSWNCGMEGPSDDESVRSLRKRQRRNFLLTLYLSLGVPMLSGGDELGRSQSGNNNAYCHDSPLTWTPWARDDEREELMSFVESLAALRASQPALRRRAFFRSPVNPCPGVRWFGTDGLELAGAAWQESDRHTLAVLFEDECALDGADALLVVFNAAGSTAQVRLPAPGVGRRWELRLDTEWPKRTPTVVAPGEDWPLAAYAAAVFRQAATNSSGSASRRT